MQPLKLIILGDGAIGKTCSLITYTERSFPKEYIPTVFDNYEADVIINGQAIKLGLWDTAGREDYDRLRPLSYPGTDVFVVAFSVISPHSFANISTKWAPEIRHHMPKTPFVIAGLKTDLRDNQEMCQKLASKKESPITAEMGKKLAKEIGAMGYVEFSSVTQKGLDEAFEHFVAVALTPYDKSTPLPPPKPNLPTLFKPKMSEDVWLESLQKSMKQSMKSEDGDIQIVSKDEIYHFQKINLLCGSKIFRDYYMNGKNDSLFEEKENEKLARIKDKERSNLWVPTSCVYTYGADVGRIYAEGRYGHSCVVHNNILYTIGGVDCFGNYLDNMLRYNIETHTWLEAVTWGGDVNYPKNNFHATLQKSDGTVLVFGGKSNGYSKNVWSLDLETLSWALLKTSGDVPAGRYGHTVVINEENTKVYLFGGYDNDLGVNNDLYELDLGTMNWTYIKCTKDQGIPEARYGHYSFLTKDKKKNLQILVFGGRGAKGVLGDLWAFDVKKLQWHELPVDGEKPEGRYGFGAFVSDGEFFIFGGFDGNTVVFKDSWAINFKSSKRKWRNFGEQGFIERYYQTINHTPQGIVIFGGRRADHYLCLYVEEGINRGKKFQLRNDIKKLTLKQEVAKEGILSNWLNEICDVKNNRVIVEKLKPFVTKYGEHFEREFWFKENLIKYAVDESFFTDMEVKLLDSIEPAHSFYLKLNADLLPNITKHDIQASIQKSHPLPLPFTKADWTQLKQYFYTRTIHVTQENHLHLLLLATKHHLDLLIELSCKQLFSHPDILHTMQIGLENNIEPVITYAIWCMKCNFAIVRDDPRFEKLPEEVKKEVMNEAWPGKAYQQALENWRDEQEKKKNESCSVQ